MRTARDRARLREVAGAYASMVTSEEMGARREIWRRTNRLEERTVPFQIEDNGSFFHDLTPPPQCEGGYERHLEWGMLRALTNHRLIDDDRVFPPRCEVHWVIHRTSICPELEITRAADARGRELGYHTNTPLADLENGLEKLRPTEFTVDREETERRREVAESAFGDILPVEVVGHDVTFAGTSLAQKAVHLIGMDRLYMAMLDQPEHVHAFFEFVASDAGRQIDWLEEERLISLNNHEMDVGSGACGYTDDLPARALADGEPVLARDCWAWIEAQEAVGISPGMFAGFIAPYQRRIADRMGLVYYGCCEPVHEVWPTLAEYGNIRKVTVSPWCDQRSIADSVGRSVVLSRKPHPMKLCGARFDPADFEAHIRETLEIAADRFVELIFRDTCGLTGRMADRVAEACRIVRTLVGRAQECRPS